MTDKTRDGRVSKARGQKGPRGKSAAKSSIDRQPTEATPAKQTRSSRGRQRGGRTPRQETQSKATKTAKKAAPAPEPKVERIGNDLFTSTVETHLAFVAENHLATDPNTETIALNVMDHIVRPENWDASLTRNVLFASCFYFAGMVTGKQNSASSVAVCISWYWEKRIQQDPEYEHEPWFVKQQATLAMSVTMDQVEQGYALLWDQRDRLEDLVGDYKQSLAQLPTPTVERHTSAEANELQALDEELLALAGEEQWEGYYETYYAPDHHLDGGEAFVEGEADEDYAELTYGVDQSELDDFDLYVEENE